MNFILQVIKADLEERYAGTGITVEPDDRRDMRWRDCTGCAGSTGCAGLRGVRPSFKLT